MPLWNLLGQVGDMYCLSNTYRMLFLHVNMQDKYVNMQAIYVNMQLIYGNMQGKN